MLLLVKLQAFYQIAQNISNASQVKYKHSWKLESFDIPICRAMAKWPEQQASNPIRRQFHFY